MLCGIGLTVVESNSKRRNATSRCVTASRKTDSERIHTKPVLFQSAPNIRYWFAADHTYSYRFEFNWGWVDKVACHKHYEGYHSRRTPISKVHDGGINDGTNWMGSCAPNLRLGFKSMHASHPSLAEVHVAAAMHAH